MKFIELKNVNKTYKNGITAVADICLLYTSPSPRD